MGMVVYASGGYSAMSITVTDTSSPVVIQTSGAQGPPGLNGAAGTSATVSAGTATALASGSSPTVTNVGTSSAAIFDFGIPAGTPGPTGATGPSGLGSTVANGTYQAAAVTVSGGQITALQNNPIVSTSSGTANAGNVVALNNSGILDISMTSAFVKFRAWRSAALTLGPGQTTLPLDTVTYNSTTYTILQSNGTIMVPTAGYYHIDATVGIFPTASGTDCTAALIIEKGGQVNNGESIYGFQGRIDGVSNNANIAASGIMYLLPTDTLYLSVFVQLATSLFAGYESMNLLSLYGPL